MIPYQKLGFDTYEAYLASDHWLDFRKQYSESGLPQTCRGCGSPEIQLHHTTYVRLGCEQLTDVVPLCGKCHKAVHREHSQNSIRLHDVDGALKSASRMTKQNSTKRERKTQNRRRRTAKRLLRQESESKGSTLIQCPKCGRRAWQEGLFCCVCGTLSEQIKSR